MSRHITVMEGEAVSALKIGRNSVVVDATANGGGHSHRIADIIGEHGTLIAIDVDPAACALLTKRFREQPQVKIVEANFRTITKVLDDMGITSVDGILADLGWSTNQFETSEGYAGRGFSFKQDEPLLMTYGDKEQYPFTARDIVNRWKEEDIANVLYGYAEERHSRKIARAIVRAREEGNIETSGALRDVVERAVPRSGKLHPATKTFQALRIAVNDEFGALREFITSSIDALSRGGTLAIISFHSLEDRIVKHMYKEAERNSKGHPIKKPIVPSEEEIKNNPRARSAKLRTFTKI